MGKYDDSMYRYLDNNERFADLCNVALFQGEQVIQGGMLEADDGRYVMKTEDADMQTVNRFRDLKKRMKNGGWLAVMAIENQEAVDYSMPFRMMLMDTLEYAKQVKKLRDDKEAYLKRQGNKSGGWNTRPKKEDKLAPVYSVCFYHGTAPWDGPLSLKDMMDFDDAEPEWKNLFHDYGMTLLCANQVEDASLFQTGLRQVVKVIPLRRKKQELKELFKQEEFRHLDRDTAEMIAVFTDRRELMNKQEEREEVDMCQAMDELEQDWFNEGMECGIAQGIEQGIAQGIEQGIERGVDIGMEQATERMMKLIARLSADGEVDLITGVSQDKALLEELYGKYEL